MKFTHLRFPFPLMSEAVEEDNDFEREEPTVKLDLAIERLKEATDRRERVRQRMESSPALPAVKVSA